MPGPQRGGPEGVIGRKTRVSVRIFGEEYTIVGDADPDYIRKIAGEMDERMRKVADANPRLSAHRLAVLVALNVADELEKLRSQHEELIRLIDETK